MHPDKGVLTAIRVARRAGVPLRIAAKMQNAEELEYFRDVVGPELGGDIECVGGVGPQDKYTLLGGAIALLKPIQWSEPFGMVMIEAMATGTPVISTPRGAAPEIVEDGATGFIRDTPGHWPGPWPGAWSCGARIAARPPRRNSAPGAWSASASSSMPGASARRTGPMSCPCR
ncbi:hypothetical protein DQ353_19000 [Arthrobacter sp. AQ5-05]|uniref:glycosyltransferase n=1 Tax=Arthrobacter sp. AQ5-05 TaxID=2184581 RepID=UPI000DCF0D37|nr:glycosyltransferase [Arthrobacter sp. AQ5-05]RAX47324.1 hypothetical protein DQ353_19000 [Arthrobacter sp. AQ5-05]